MESRNTALPQLYAQKSAHLEKNFVITKKMTQMVATMKTFA
jgi:hypothetical protein